jgi:hypothetical protein
MGEFAAEERIELELDFKRYESERALIHAEVERGTLKLPFDYGEVTPPPLGRKDLKDGTDIVFWTSHRRIFD